MGIGFSDGGVLFMGWSWELGRVLAPPPCAVFLCDRLPRVPDGYDIFTAGTDKAYG